ncbi:response regulator [Chitinimonas lacunae]|uniref:Response regulator n=1 Tax=Chitinimonas lacunae TaxID=1963018 RepID=A0ABV8MLR5_9NEIS
MEQLKHVEILLVEDNPLDAELTMRGLESAKVCNKVIWLNDGDLALDYLLRRGSYADRDGPDPGVILLDLKMPRVDGMEVLTQLKANESTRRIPVVVMTSSHEEQDMVRSYDLGVNSYVVKPVEFDDLTELARHAGFYWLVLNQRPVD